VTVFVAASVTGAPGATRLALGLAAAWPVPGRRRVLIEADPDGGRLGAELGVGVEPGLMTLALAARTAALTADAIVTSATAPIADWFVVPAPPSAEQAHSALVHGASTVAAAMSDDDGRAADRPPTEWIVDAGRLHTRSPALPLAQAAAHVLLVTHGSFPEVQLVPHRVEALRRVGCWPDVVVVEPTPWSPDEIAEFVGADVLSVLPHVRGGRRSSVTAMRTNVWRPWWNAVEDLATYLAGTGAGAELPTELDAEAASTDGVLEEAAG